MVQVKKTEVRDALLLAAKKEFLRAGYLQSSIRDISKEAGTTIGNMYKYFQNKEELFNQLVTEAKRNIFFIIKGQETNEDGLPLDVTMQLQRFVSVISEYRDELLLLVDASKGTIYQNTYDELIEIILSNLKEHLPDFEMDNSETSNNLVRTLAVGILSGIMDVVRRNEDKKEIQSGLIQYFTFIFKSFI